MSLARNKYLVPILTVLILIGVAAAVLALTRAASEHLAPLKPRVLIFGATWCPRCPTDKAVQKLANDFPAVIVEHIDVDRRAALAKFYHVKQLPTFIVCDIAGCKVFNSMTAVRAWLTKLNHEQ